MSHFRRYFSPILARLHPLCGILRYFNKKFSKCCNDSAKKSPLAPRSFPDLPAISGVELAVAKVGFLYKNRLDYFLARLCKGAVVVGTFTKSKTRSAAVEYARQTLKRKNVGLIVTNSGNANAFTGKKGHKENLRLIALSKKIANIGTRDAISCSTGVIGQVLDTNPLAKIQQLSFSATWQQSAKAILTTDTFEKGATATAKIGDIPIKISGIAKGSGMIAPHLATMLAYVFTDAKISYDSLQEMVKELVEGSFNAITVDGDTSTSDSVIVCATGMAGNSTEGDLSDFKEALRHVFQDLAQQIVKDGEGATKYITVNVKGAKTDASAKNVAFSIASSPLVKTAMAGEDANWGRIVMAVGKSGEYVDRDTLSIAIGGIEIATLGEGVKHYNEQAVTKHLQRQNIVIDVNLHIAMGKATVWTCDLTHGYIDINANYRS